MGALEEYGRRARSPAIWRRTCWGRSTSCGPRCPFYGRRSPGTSLICPRWRPSATTPAFPSTAAAKAGLDAASDALRDETRPLGIKVTVVVPGPFRTDFIGRSLEQAAGHLEDYDKTSGKFAAYLEKINGAQPGDPDAAA